MIAPNVVVLKVGTAFVKMGYGMAHLVRMLSLRHCPEGGTDGAAIDTHTSVRKRGHHAFQGISICIAQCCKCTDSAGTSATSAFCLPEYGDRFIFLRFDS